MNATPEIAVIGAGAAGLFAAGAAGEAGCRVTLYEKNDRPGIKLSITGKGRCNVTNNTTPNEVIENIPTNAKFLYTAINAFSPADTMRFFEALGVALKTERGNRVFPVSDRANDIVDALYKNALQNGVRLVYQKITGLCIKDGRVCGVTVGGQTVPYDRVIVATGGLSYPRTGSTGDGYRFAKQAGLELTPTAPSLVPIETTEPWSHTMSGLALKNVALWVEDTHSGRAVYRDFGEMLFTHFGISGPMVLSASSHLRTITPGKYRVHIDLKPALTEKTLDERLQNDFRKYANKDFANALNDLLPRSLIPTIIRLSGIDRQKKVSGITKEERRTLLTLLKDLQITLKRFRPIDEAIITSGGVCVKELNPKTMESKKVNGLHFAGEVIDVDAYTGGFNLQIAFSTAMLAAKAVSIRSEL